MEFTDPPLLADLSEWARDVHANIRRLLPGGAASSGRKQVEEVMRLRAVASELTDLLRERPRWEEVASPEQHAALVAMPQLLETAQIVVNALSGATTKRPPKSILAGVRRTVSKQDLDVVFEDALAEVEALQAEHEFSRAIAEKLTSRQRSWILVVGDLTAKPKGLTEATTVTHATVAKILGIAEKTSSNMIARLRTMGLLGPIPRTNYEGLTLSEQGLRVYRWLKTTVSGTSGTQG